MWIACALTWVAQLFSNVSMADEIQSKQAWNDFAKFLPEKIQGIGKTICTSAWNSSTNALTSYNTLCYNAPKLQKFGRNPLSAVLIVYPYQERFHRTLSPFQTSPSSVNIWNRVSTVKCLINNDQLLLYLPVRFRIQPQHRVLGQPFYYLTGLI